MKAHYQTRRSKIKKNVIIKKIINKKYKRKINYYVKRKLEKKLDLKKLGILNIHCSYNNTIINLTDHKGNTLAWKSAGSLGFKGGEKGSPHAARKASEALFKKILDKKFTNLLLRFKGFGSGRKGAIKGLKARRVQIMSIQDKTPMPHNGCRPKKRRRK